MLIGAKDKHESESKITNSHLVPQLYTLAAAQIAKHQTETPKERTQFCTRSMSKEDMNVSAESIKNTPYHFGLYAP